MFSQNRDAEKVTLPINKIFVLTSRPWADNTLFSITKEHYFQNQHELQAFKNTLGNSGFTREEMRESVSFNDHLYLIKEKKKGPKLVTWYGSLIRTENFTLDHTTTYSFKNKKVRKAIENKTPLIIALKADKEEGGGSDKRITYTYATPDDMKWSSEYTLLYFGKDGFHFLSKKDLKEITLTDIPKNQIKPQPSIARQDDIPDEFLDPITQEEMKQPMICTLDSQTYDESFIRPYLEKYRKSPSFEKYMQPHQKIDDIIVPNLALKSLIEKHHQKVKNADNVSDSVSTLKIKK